jgi:A/G-specific adenine glycosylase
MQTEQDGQVEEYLSKEILSACVEPLVAWFRQNQRILPWREDKTAYRVWVSEIMLQQTRVEAVKPYYERFLQELPTVADLAVASEEKLLKLWEGLGYYNRVRNMQKAACQVMEVHGGKFPTDYEEILSLTGIGSYTAGAISSFAYGQAKPAVDGNVLRVVSRVLVQYDDIMKASVRTKMERQIEAVIPVDAASDFNQGLIELGAMICVPNGVPKCESCPLVKLCRAKELGVESELPVKKKAKERRIEKRTVLRIQEADTLVIRKRPKKGLLSGLYELPNLEGHLSVKEVIEYSESIGLVPLRVKEQAPAKHIFSHVEWHMIGYEIWVDELEKRCKEDVIFANTQELEEKYPIPTAFEAYVPRFLDR